MRINRQHFVGMLESADAGLLERDTSLQSSCFVFENGHIRTFNDQIACTTPSPVAEHITGAVPAKKLLAILNKFTDEEVDISQGEGMIVILGPKKKTEMRFSTDIQMPKVELPGENAEWTEIPPEFSTAVKLVSACAGKDENKQSLMCVCVRPDAVEATDEFQIGHHPIQTGLKQTTLVRADTLAKMANLGMTHVYEGTSLLHFKNEDGLIFSCRRDFAAYPELKNYYQPREGVDLVIPTGLDDAITRAALFSVDNNVIGNMVTVGIKKGLLMIKGEGASGTHREKFEIESAEGVEIMFRVGPDLLKTISSRANRCTISEGSLRIVSGDLVYVSCTQPVPEGEKF